MKKSGIQICPNKPLKLRLIQHWQLYLLLAPAVLYLILFNYAPLYGLIIAFKTMPKEKAKDQAPSKEVLKALQNTKVG